MAAIFKIEHFENVLLAKNNILLQFGGGGGGEGVVML